MPILNSTTHSSHAVFICTIFLLVSILSVDAQSQNTYHSTYINISQGNETNDNFIYQPHQSTIYQPFTISSPCQNTSDTPFGIVGRKNSPNNSNDIIIPDDFGHLDDPGNRSEQSPIGEPWIMIFFAAILTLFTIRKNIIIS